MKWLTHWLDAGSRAIEDVLVRDPRTGRFCCGDRPTIADICLVAHLTSAKMLCDRDPALRIYCLQQWYNLSDPGAEEARSSPF